jgi:hypothetical protein
MPGDGEKLPSARCVLLYFVWLAGGLNQVPGSRLMNPWHALFQPTAGADVSAVPVHCQHMLSCVAHFTSQREPPLKRDGQERRRQHAKSPGKRDHHEL